MDRKEAIENFKKEMEKEVTKLGAQIQGGRKKILGAFVRGCDDWIHEQVRKKTLHSMSIKGCAKRLNIAREKFRQFLETQPLSETEIIVNEMKRLRDFVVGN